MNRSISKLRAILWISALAGVAGGRAFAADPGITNQPASLSVLQGSPATFSVGAEGTAPFTYQWRRNGTEILNATNISYTIAATAIGDDNVQFSVVVSNAVGNITSANALLRVDPGALVTTTMNLVNISTHNWRYLTNGSDQGTVWTNNAFVDSTWNLGAALFGVEVAGVYAEPIRSPFTAYTQPITNYYFRTHFTYNPTGNIAGVLLSASANVDDGAAFYVNGAEVARIRLAAGANAATFATGDNEGGTETFTINPANLVVGDNVLAVEVHQQSAASSDIVFGMNLALTVTNRVPDTIAPAIAAIIPQQNFTVLLLNQIEVQFTEEVQGVEAADLLINTTQPASAVFHEGVGQYRFTFTQPATGMVSVAFAAGHGITDLASTLNPFAGGSWSYTLDPNAAGSDIRISEFMADNQTGARDEEGNYSDWIELHNSSPIVVNLGGWFLTDDILAPTKWRIPDGVALSPSSYLLIWATENNRTNPAAPLHTNFRLDPDGEFLGLYDPNTNLASSFGSIYPPQRPDVSYGRDRLAPLSTGYYSTPSPGANNPAGGPSSDFAPDVVFSRKSGTFSSTFNAALSLAAASPNAVIRYVVITNLTLVTGNNVITNVPTATSPAYSGPLPIFHTTQIRARAFEPGKLPGTPVTVTYVQLHANVLGWSSDLPVCIVHVLSAGSVSTAGDQAAVFMTFENDCGRSSLTNMPQLATRMGVNTRGSSTGGQAKSNYAVELWDEFNQDGDRDVLGMPSESDWVLYGINGFDPGLMHNAIFNWFGRQLDNQTASRTRYVEVFRKLDAGPVTTADYFGLYLLEEKPKRNKNRTDIEALQLEETNSPAITGGYLMRIDRTDGNERFFSPPQIGSIRPTPANVIIDYPNTPNTTPDPRAHLQSNYIRGYIQAFLTNLDSVSYTNTVTGYHQFIDADQWVDNLIGNIICFNVDGYRLSGYFYKDRNDRLKQGPYWDCDRCLGTGGGGGGATPQGDNRCFSPYYWRLPATAQGTDNGTDFFGLSTVGVSWFARLFTDPDFWQRFIDRYQMHRTNAYSTNAVLAMVDRLHDEIREAQTREVQRWATTFSYPRSGSHNVNGYSFNFGAVVGPGSAGAFSNEVNFQKKWLVDRFQFLDTNFLAMPTQSLGTALVPGGTVVSVSPAGKAGTLLLYTLDGTDPRLPGGAVSPAARTNVGTLPLTVTNNVRLFARSYNTSHYNVTNGGSSLFGNPLRNSFWSGPVAATYYTTVPPLRITELMYHPAPPPAGNTNDRDNFEYIEVRNISPDPSGLNVNGFRLRGGVDFDFPNVTLTNGQSAVLVKHIAAFQSRYPGVPGPLILGSYTNNLANDGDHLILQGSLREPILDFDYDDDWYKITDGPGFSLQIVNDGLATTNWGLKASWRPSGSLDGTPGASDPGPATIATIFVNEALTHTDLPLVDAIELCNPGGTPVNVGGWFLTDDFGNPRKYRIPDPTIIGAGNYHVFHADTSFSNAFNLSSKGDELFLFSGDPATTNVTGYVHGFDFGAQASGVTFGRHVVASTGNDHFIAQTNPTLGFANSGPRVGPIIISEIMYHPSDIPTIEGPRDNGKDEYVELANISGTNQPLHDPAYATNTWQLRDAVSYTFPTNVFIPAGGYILVVSFDPADLLAASEFRQRNFVTEGTALYGPWQGQLDNSGDSVELVRPDVPQPQGAPDAGAVYDILADKVNYSDTLPWPEAADSLGFSLQRAVVTAYGNDPANWSAAGGSPGAAFVPGTPPVITQHPQSQTALASSTVMFSVVASPPPLTYKWRRNGTSITGATNSILTLPNVQTSQSGQYQCIVLNPSGPAISSNATLNVVQAAAIFQQPTNTDVRVRPDPSPDAIPGTNAVLTVGATSGNPPLTYQWRFHGTNIANPTKYSGLTNATLTVSNVTTADYGPYSCALTDGVGTIFSANAILSPLVRPSILIGPSNQTVAALSPLTVSVVLSNGFPPSFGYFWLKGSTPLTNMVSDLKTNFFVIPAVTIGSNAGATAYWIRPTNRAQVSPIISNSVTFSITVLADTDRDRLPDAYETAAGLNPADPADAALDADGDTMSNLAEYVAGTNPTNAASYLRVSFTNSLPPATVVFAAVSNRTYTVEYTDTLPANLWTRLADVVARSFNRVETNVDPNWTSNRFYRAVTPRQP